MTEFLSVENYQSYSPVAYEVVLSVLALGFAVMGAAFVYFIASSSNIAPRWRITSTISAVVMVSAFLELFLLLFDWQSVFALSGGTWERDPDAGVFSNGYRYMNWAIDVPMLMLQLLIVLGFVAGSGSALPGGAAGRCPPSPAPPPGRNREPGKRDGGPRDRSPRSGSAGTPPSGPAPPGFRSESRR